MTKSLAENWIPLTIKGAEPAYQYEISEYGNVRIVAPKHKVIKLSTIKGYPFLNVKMIDGKRATFYVHKLVAEHFLPTPLNGASYVVHIDFNKSNNHFRNLRWVNRAELTVHHKNNPNQVKGIIRNSKLTETDVIRLKKKLLRGKNPLYKIAKEFGITHTQLNRIRSGENWGHIKI